MNRRQVITISIDIDILDELDAYCKVDGHIRSIVVEKAINKYLDDLNDRKETRPY